MAGEVAAEAAALHVGGGGEAGVVEEELGEIEIERDVLVDGAGLEFAGVLHEEGHAEGLFVHEALVEPAVVAEEEALV